MYRTEEMEWKRRIREEKAGIVRISILAAVLVFIVMVLDSIKYGADFSVFLFALVYVSLFGLIAGLSFAVCSVVRSRRSLPFIRTAVISLLYMAFPIVLFTFGIICVILGIGPVPN
ncbi:MAG: hypothetical protein Q4C77_07875 [Eubacteriales bacterium]|nr:hypothetical protein [Eubacteriales bacterium]